MPNRTPKSKRTFRYSRKFNDYGNKMLDRDTVKRNNDVRKFLWKHKDRAYTLSELVENTKRSRQQILEDLRHLMSKGKVVAKIDLDDKIVFMWRVE